jgi:hypothetical protein
LATGRPLWAVELGIVGAGTVRYGHHGLRFPAQIADLAIRRRVVLELERAGRGLKRGDQPSVPGRQTTPAISTSVMRSPQPAQAMRG